MVFNGPSPTWIRHWGWFGNQPLWRERHGQQAITNMTEARRQARRRRRLSKLTSIVTRVPRALMQPKKIFGYLMWITRDQRTAVLLRLGRPVPERLREAYFLDLHQRAERAYMPEPWDGDMLVFYGENLYEDPTLGWSDFVRGTIDTVEVPGHHPGNREAMMEPAVAYTAAALSERLAALEDGSHRGRTLGLPPVSATIDRIRVFIVDELGWRGAELTPDFPLLENRVIDSLGLFRIVGFIEDSYGVSIPDEKVVPANFQTLTTIAGLVEQAG